MTMQTVQVLKSIDGLGLAGDIIQFDDTDPRWATFLGDGFMALYTASAPDVSPPTDLVGPVILTAISGLTLPTSAVGWLAITIDGNPHHIAVY